MQKRKFSPQLRAKYRPGNSTLPSLLAVIFETFRVFSTTKYNYRTASHCVTLKISLFQKSLVDL